MMDFIRQEHWDKSYEKIKITIASENDTIRRLIENSIPNVSGTKSMVEIGCFPGRYMFVFGEKGYELNGMDTTPRVNELQEVLRQEGFKVGSIEQEDFFTYCSKKFDVVCSFGFIEHFTDFLSVIEKHLDLVKDEGYVLITAPNFRGVFQYLYHTLFDRENLKQHNVKSMRPYLWKKCIASKGFEIISCGFMGNERWKEKPNTNLFMKLVEIAIIRLMKISCFLFPKNSWACGHCFVFAKKSTRINA